MLACFASAWGAEEVSASLVLRVDRPEEVIDAVVADAVARGGWFSRRTDEEVTIRVPVAQAEAALDAAAGLGRVADRGIERTDATEALAALDAKLGSREEAMARYEAVMAEATPKSVVAVQRQILRLVEEMEGIKGQRRVLTDRTTWATVSIATRFEDRRAPVHDGESSFAWIDALDLADLLGAFRTGWDGWRTQADLPVPDGFSAWRRPHRFRAVSADGVVLRARTFRRQPEADLVFWIEALRNHLDDSGYTVTGHAEVVLGGVPAIRFEAEAPCGEGDCAWRVLAAPRGRHVLVVEAGGPVPAVAARAAAVDAAAAIVRW